MSSSRLLISILLCYAATLSAFAKKAFHAESATVISQNIGSYYAGAVVAPVGPDLIGARINLKQNWVVLQTAKTRLTLQEFTRSPNWHHFIVLPVNGTVQYYRDGDWLVILDSKHRKHKFAVVHIEVQAQ